MATEPQQTPSWPSPPQRGLLSPPTPLPCPEQVLGIWSLGSQFIVARDLSGQQPSVLTQLNHKEPSLVKTGQAPLPLPQCVFPRLDPFLAASLG